MTNNNDQSPWLPIDLVTKWRDNARQLRRRWGTDHIPTNNVAQVLDQCADDLQRAIVYDDVKMAHYHANPILPGVGGGGGGGGLGTVTFAGGGSGGAGGGSSRFGQPVRRPYDEARMALEAQHVYQGRVPTPERQTAEQLQRSVAKVLDLMRQFGALADVLDDAPYPGYTYGAVCSGGSTCRASTHRSFCRIVNRPQL
ncbi:hypothetical protein GCM10007304_17880 [Rhodococcoides trifolii]|uniref:Uncharacterized protein n=1 Tax=Rhodococcoides trifolii TaxID=908250 RepID=A0A917CZX2_9NOCA|nr:hypothetical protein [Rhodococcus trifolii]GGG04169.1 hypothetical protein GCM10007304_17880 [Rhodococcus trifolii]